MCEVKRKPVRPSVLAVLVFAASACDTAAPRPTAEVVDSAGTRIVRYDLTDVSVPVYRVLAEHDLEIGTLDGDPEYAFSRITDLVLSADGGVLMSDAVTQEIRLFDVDGRYEGTIGRNGEGPGEFATAPTIIDLSADTVFAFDSRNRRISAFLLSGELVDETTLRIGEGGRPQSVIRLTDGSYLSRSTWLNPAKVDEAHDVRLELDSIVVEHLDESGAVLDTLGIVADRPRARRQQISAGGQFRVLQAVPPYAAQAQMRSDGTRLILARQEAFRIDMIDPSGRSEASLRVNGVQHPATAQQIRARQEADILEDLGHLDLDPLTYALNLEFLPERLPPFGRVVVSQSSDVWVSLTEFGFSEGLDWLVFSPAGELRGLVHTPPDFRLRAVGENVLIGFVLSELDVPYIRRYPLLDQSN
jgi:6-bladed beta-propeller